MNFSCKMCLALGLSVLQLSASPAVAARRPVAVSKGKAKAAVAIPIEGVIKRVFDAQKSEKLPTSWAFEHDNGYGTKGSHRYVSRREYTDLRNGVEELLRRYPPNKYFFVGLGRDPAPVIAFLQNLGEKRLAVNLPGTSNIAWVNAGLKRKDVARHIEAAIPENILKGERQIVLLDVTSSGKTPGEFGPFMDAYLKARGTKTPSVKLAFSWFNVKEKGSSYGAKLTDWIDTTKWKDFSNYYTGKYEGAWQPGTNYYGIGEHQRHSMTVGAEPPKETNPRYQKFRDALMARMQQDTTLDKFLTKEVGLPVNKNAVSAQQ